MRPLLLLPIIAALTACNMDPTGSNAKNADNGSAASGRANSADALAARDPAPGAAASQADDQPRPEMQLQVVLDRLGFTPGVVDGKEGLSTRNAIAGFQEARGLSITGKLDAPTREALAQWSNIPATRMVTIPDDFAAGPFQPTPAKAADQAKLPALGYQTLDEKLAERFHTTPEVLIALNTPANAPANASGNAAASAPAAPPSGAAAASSAPPAAVVTHFRAGQQIRVPNVGGDRIDAGAVADAAWRDTLAVLGVGSAQPAVTKIVVSKSKGTLRAYDEGGKLVGMYTATMGSRHDPLPLGRWKVQGVARNPDFAYNPDLFWDVPDSAEKQRLPPGPNGPVGVAWIDLNKPHYGIHGTPEPQTIGRAQSHGCVRLTNWDVARLTQMVKPGAQVLFEA